LNSLEPGRINNPTKKKSQCTQEQCGANRDRNEY
jgi:hypothetical protein